MNLRIHAAFLTGVELFISLSTAAPFQSPTRNLPSPLQQCTSDLTSRLFLPHLLSLPCTSTDQSSRIEIIMGLFVQPPFAMFCLVGLPIAVCMEQALTSHLHLLGFNLTTPDSQRRAPKSP